MSSIEFQVVHSKVVEMVGFFSVEDKETIRAMAADRIGADRARGKEPDLTDKFYLEIGEDDPISFTYGGGFLLAGMLTRFARETGDAIQALDDNLPKEMAAIAIPYRLEAGKAAGELSLRLQSEYIAAQEVAPPLLDDVDNWLRSLSEEAGS